jgi:MacB-like periplasmic core domain/FtsX-like permease family
MIGPVLRVAWYRFRATLGHRWGGYVSVVLLVGLVGGVAMGSIAAARRTQSSFSVFLASTNPSDLSMPTFGAGAISSASANYSATLTKEIADLPGVRHAEAWVNVNAAPMRPDGAPAIGHLAQIYSAASVDGLYFNQDRVAVTQGRMADPRRPDEFVMTPVAARLLGLHVGETVPYGFFTNHQTGLPGIGTPSVQPYRRIDAKLVGLVVLSSEIVQDQVDRLPALVLFTPAFAKEVLVGSGRGAGGVIYYGLQLDHGSRDVAGVERALARLLPGGTEYNFHTTAPIEAKVGQVVRPVAIALGVFGAIAALAALLIAGQLISRQLRTASGDLTVLRALGADPAVIAADGLFGVIGAVVLGSLLAVAVAVALSPLSPLGPVGPVYPSRGLAFDWPILGIGSVVLIGGISSMAVTLARREAPHRVALRSRLAPARTSKVARVIISMGLPAPGAVGVRLALEPGDGRTAVPVRSALLGATLAVAMVVAALTFGSGLQTLISHPALYGWNWTYLLNASNDVPPQALALLNRDHDVAAWTGTDHNAVEIDGQQVPALFGDTHATLTPPILAGHAVTQKNQIVLGVATLAQLHKHVGDTVVVSYGQPRDAPLYIPPTHLVIVGTATMPAVGSSGIFADHASMGTGALVSAGIEPAAYQQAQLSHDPTLNGPNIVFVKLRSGVSRTAGLAGLQRIADDANRAFAAVPDGGGGGYSVAVLGVQRPAEIVNYRTMGAAPVILAAGLAVGALAALALTLAASVRRRRRDLALLKTLGFTRGQLAGAVAWQASVAAVIGIAVGVPAGVALGRRLWVLFAQAIYAVPEPTVPVLPVILIALGALVLANIAAAIPGRLAARTPAARLLRAQ